jgi:hypothetical protein
MRRFLTFVAVFSIGCADPPAPNPVDTSTPYLDLQPHANFELAQAFHYGETGNDLADVPRGERTFADVKFRVGKRFIRLGSQFAGANPLKVEGIRVERSFKTLHILHGTEYGSGPDGSPSIVEDGIKIGEYRIHYEDGATEKMPITYGTDVRDWWDWDGRPVTRGKQAWHAPNTVMKGSPLKVRLYLATWTNPRPNVKVTSIDFVSNNEKPAPFCLAMTVERNQQ